jgi:hypothetical protein
LETGIQDDVDQNKRRESIEKQLFRAHISENDFQQANEFLQAFQAAKGVVQRRALLTAAVIAYARPFSDNERSDTTRATSSIRGNPKKILGLEGALVHGHVIKLRNEAIAHATWLRNPVGITPSVETPVIKARRFDILGDPLTHARDREAFLRITDLMRRH